MSEMWYTYWLACVEGITGDRKCELCRKNGSAEAVYYIEEKGIREQIITEKEWGILKESKKKRNRRESRSKRRWIICFVIKKLHLNGSGMKDRM